MANKLDIKEREKEKTVVSDVIGQTQAGTIERIPNLKKRQRAIYYRPVTNSDGTVEWSATQPLPSDASGRELYLSKGFRLKPPKPNEGVAPDTSDAERQVLLAENEKLRNQLKMANVRAARNKEPSESLSGTL